MQKTIFATALTLVLGMASFAFAQTGGIPQPPQGVINALPPPPPPPLFPQNMHGQRPSANAPQQRAISGGGYESCIKRCEDWDESEFPGQQAACKAACARIYSNPKNALRPAPTLPSQYRIMSGNEACNECYDNCYDQAYAAGVEIDPTNSLCLQKCETTGPCNKETKPK